METLRNSCNNSKETKLRLIAIIQASGYFDWNLQVQERELK